MRIFLAFLFVFLGFASVANAQLSILKPSQGGTGIGSATAGDVGDCLVVLDDSPFTYELGTCGGSGGTFPFTPTGYGNATTSVIGFLSGLISNGSTTIPSLGSGLVGANNGLLYGFASSSLFGYTPVNPTRALTVAGTAGQITSSAGSQDLSADRTWTLSLPNHVIFPGSFQAGNATTTNATTTSLAVLNLNSANCDVKSTTDGVIYCGTDSEGSATFPFTPEADGNATSTTLILKGGLISTASSTFTGNATTTGMHAFGSIRIPSLTSELLKVDANGLVAEAVAGTDYENPLTFTYPLTRSTNTISLAFGTTTSNTWAGTQTFTYASTSQLSVTGTATTTLAGPLQLTGASDHISAHGLQAVDSSGLHIHSSNNTEVAYFGAGGGANVTLHGYTSALLQAGAAGAISEYAGTSCTNQFVRSLSALGIATCATVGTADVSGLDISDDTNLAVTWPITLTGDTVGFNGISTSSAPTLGQLPYWTGVNTLGSVATGTVSAGTGISLTGTAAVLLNALTIAVNQAANFVWSGVHDFGGAVLEIPNGTGPTVDAVGETALDTTSPGSLVVATSTDASYPAVLPLVDYSRFNIGTTTWSGTTTAEYATLDFPERITKGICYTNAGTALVRVGDGTNWSNEVSVSTATTSVTFTSNNTFNAGGEKVIYQVGTPASSPTLMSCNFERRYERL